MKFLSIQANVPIYFSERVEEIDPHLEISIFLIESWMYAWISGMLHSCLLRTTSLHNPENFFCLSATLAPLIFGPQLFFFLVYSLTGFKHTFRSFLRKPHRNHFGELECPKCYGFYLWFWLKTCLKLLEPRILRNHFPSKSRANCSIIFSFYFYSWDINAILIPVLYICIESIFFLWKF